MLNWNNVKELQSNLSIQFNDYTHMKSHDKDILWVVGEVVIDTVVDSVVEIVVGVSVVFGVGGLVVTEVFKNAYTINLNNSHY